MVPGGPIPSANPICFQKVLRFVTFSAIYCFLVLRPRLGGRIQEVNRPSVGGSAFVVPPGPIPTAKPICFQQGFPVCGVFCKPCFFVSGPRLGGRIQEVNRPYIGGSALVVPTGPIPIAKPICFQQGFRVEGFLANYVFFRVAIPAQSPNPKGKSTIYWMFLSVFLWVCVCPPRVSCSPPGSP